MRIMGIITSIMAFLSYEDLVRTGVLSSEDRALQYCLDVELLRPHQFCEDCQNYMELKPCSPAMFRDGFYWSCTGAVHTISIRAASILSNRNISLSSFLHLLWIFCNGTSVADAARILSKNEKTVRSLYQSLRQCMAVQKTSSTLRAEPTERSADQDTLWRLMSRSSGKGNIIEEDVLWASGYWVDTAEQRMKSSSWSAQTTRETTTHCYGLSSRT